MDVDDAVPSILSTTLTRWCALVVDATGIGVTAWDEGHLRRALEWATQLEGLHAAAAADPTQAKLAVLAAVLRDAHWNQQAFGVDALQCARISLLKAVAQNRNASWAIQTLASSLQRTLVQPHGAGAGASDAGSGHAAAVTRGAWPASQSAAAPAIGTVEATMLNAIAGMIHALDQDPTCSVATAGLSHGGAVRGGAMATLRAAARVLRTNVSHILCGEDWDENAVDAVEALGRRKATVQPTVDGLLLSVVEAHPSNLEMVAVAATLPRPTTWHTLPQKQLHTEVTESIITWIISCKMNAAVDLPVAIRDQLTVVSSLFGEMLASVEFADADSFDFSA
eukprot:m.142109 g.142109  ORF g.142109 m.142109 type:complete len:338 (+) comp22900_c0_seq1:273-1286(+)